MAFQMDDEMYGEIPDAPAGEMDHPNDDELEYAPRDGDDDGEYEYDYDYAYDDNVFQNMCGDYFYQNDAVYGDNNATQMGDNATQMGDNATQMGDNAALNQGGGTTICGTNNSGNNNSALGLPRRQPTKQAAPNKAGKKLNVSEEGKEQQIAPAKIQQRLKRHEMALNDGSFQFDIGDDDFSAPPQKRQKLTKDNKGISYNVNVKSIGSDNFTDVSPSIRDALAPQAPAFGSIKSSKYERQSSLNNCNRNFIFNNNDNGSNNNGNNNSTPLSFTTKSSKKRQLKDQNDDIEMVPSYSTNINKAAASGSGNGTSEDETESVNSNNNNNNNVSSSMKRGNGRTLANSTEEPEMEDDDVLYNII